MIEGQSADDQYNEALQEKRFEDAAYWAGVHNSFLIFPVPIGALIDELQPYYEAYLMGYKDYNG